MISPCAPKVSAIHVLPSAACQRQLSRPFVATNRHSMSESLATATMYHATGPEIYSRNSPLEAAVRPAPAAWLLWEGLGCEGQHAGDEAGEQIFEVFLTDKEIAPGFWNGINPMLNARQCARDAGDCVRIAT